MNDLRPDPDALLARAQSDSSYQRRGQLKLFFGMCPGVGKTFAMLQEAQHKRHEGVDVVVGFVETHGRRETQALVAGLEQLSSKTIEYKGVSLREFDLDGALKRRPALVLVDELAHTNAEGLRHAKRWQDVVELLDAGINVYTTLNVQHIESLNDVVARITGVPVRETVPDSIVERADEIELVDLPPDELLQRLAEGKVYIAEQARRAADRFFRRDNLVALRELALRQTAERVGAQVQEERAVRGETRPWATADRILVCVGPSPLSARVIRTARRMASASHSEWIAVSVETPRQSELAVAQVRRNLQLAERLGAETAVLTGEHVVDEIMAYAVKRNISKIVIGKPEMPRWRELIQRTIVDELIRRSGEIDVHMVKGAPEDVGSNPPARKKTKSSWQEYGWTLLVMAVCTALASALFGHLAPANLTMIYLAGVVFISTRFSMVPSAIGSILAAMLYDFIFTEPYYSFSISDTEYVIACLVLLTTALVISGLTQRVRRQSEAARTRYLRTVALYFMSRQLAAAADIKSLANFSARHVSDVFHGDTAILVPDTTGKLAIVSHHGIFLVEPANERAAAQWVFDHQQWAGWSTETLRASAAIYLPLVASEKALGVLALRPREPEQLLEADQRHLLETFATQLAVALERAALTSQAEFARRSAETEQTRSALLSCVSHDLRTPLAAISGAASALLENDDRLTHETRHELLASITEEADRLNQLVGKLLEMTRLESAGFELEKDWHALDELVGSALYRLRARLKNHTVQTDIPNDLPLVHVDGILIEEVLANLIENADRYAPPYTKITIRARVDPDRIRAEVLDEGPGITPGKEAEIFQRFVRQRAATDRLGTGLGLAICEAVVKLHGGEIAAENRPNGGARFWFTIPMSDAKPPVVLAEEKI